uniref:Glutamate--tRNA ligase n=1 Tax=Ignisphaera aggregans TaxID=334771 RepID=A0A7C2Z1D1_9CREN
MSSSLPEPLKEQVRKTALKHAIANRLKYGQARIEPVINKVFGEFRNFRQYSKEIASLVREVVQHVNSLSTEELRNLSEEVGVSPEGEAKTGARTLPPLPNTESWGRIVTRFAPNPDFVIHLGNARVAIISYTYATIYKGKFILRFEDTDPRTKRPIPEAYRIIREDLKWLSISWDEEYIQSLRMNIYYEYLRKLVANGHAYVDLCKPEIFRDLRNKGIACPHRSEDPSVHMDRLDKIFAGEYGEGEAVIRLKTDLNYADPSVRDWVLFRIIDTARYPHPITGDKYILWPTYNFAAAIDDHLMGVSHILRGREHTVNTIKQMFIYSYLGWRYPEVLNLGRVGLEKSILSKTWIKTQLKSNPDKFMGIDDIRFGTISALRRRGIAAETIKQIILELGVKGVDAIISWENIAATNRKILDPVSKRVFVVPNPVKIEILGVKEKISVDIPFHPSSNLGSRRFTISSPEVYISSRDAETFRKVGFLRLMEFANIKFVKEKDGKIVAEFLGRDVEEAKKLGAPIVQWVPVEHSTKVIILKPEGLKLRKIKCVGEDTIKGMREGEVVQMVRLGFGRIDRISGDLVVVIHAHD